MRRRHGRADPRGRLHVAAGNGAALAPSWLPVDWLVTQKFATLEKIAKVPAPVLIVHGIGDQLVPHRFSETLYAAARDPKKLVLVEGGSHYNTSWTGAAAVPRGDRRVVRGSGAEEGRRGGGAIRLPKRGAVASAAWTPPNCAAPLRSTGSAHRP